MKIGRLTPKGGFKVS